MLCDEKISTAICSFKNLGLPGLYSLSMIRWCLPTIFLFVSYRENGSDQAQFTAGQWVMTKSSGFTHSCACSTHFLNLKPVRRSLAIANLLWTGYNGGVVVVVLVSTTAAVAVLEEVAAW